MANPASRNNPGSPGTQGVVSNGVPVPYVPFPTVTGSFNNPVQSPYSPGATPLPAGSPTPYGPSPSSSPSTSTAPPPTVPPTPPLDWHAYLTNWGFDQSIVDELDRIFRTYSDPNQASASAIAYIRGTDWYAKTFPGIQEGMKLGIVTDEASYRAYTNQMNDVYSRYYNRPVTGDEVANALKQGQTVGHVDAHLQGQAYIAANQGDIQATLGAFDDQGRLNDTQLGALGDQQAGLTNMMGPEIQRRYQTALARLHGIYQGTLGSPNLSMGQNGRIQAPSLLGGINQNDIGK